MVEMNLLEPSKETDKKLRWEALVGDTRFLLYIPKWRVPVLWPSKIYVRVTDRTNELKGYEPLSPDNAEKNEGMRDRPILAVVEHTSDHSQTVRYTPRGDPKEWEIGEPYIPFSLLPDAPSNVLVVKVQWDLSSKGQFPRH